MTKVIESVTRRVKQRAGGATRDRCHLASPRADPPTGAGFHQPMKTWVGVELFFLVRGWTFGSVQREQDYLCACVFATS